MKWIAPHGATSESERYRNAAPTIAGSNPDAAFFNTVLDELLAVITAANMIPTDTNLHQISDAIVYLTNRAATSGVITGSFWFGKTQSATIVPAPTAVGQTYIDFTNLKTYISNNGTSWTQSGTFVPQSDIDFTILITKKFWDITEQTDQQGGDAVYSHTTNTWTYWPKIVNLDNVATIDLSNLTDAGKNIGLWCNNAANIITEIPQDIKLELNNGTLTLKSGSKVYVPNGSGVFDEAVIENDISNSNPAIVRSGSLLTLNPNKTSILMWKPEDCYSGTTAPTPTGTNAVWYDTTNNVIKLTHDGGSTWVSGVTLPFGTASSTTTAWTSIDQIFNGFGFIGASVFALPGVKALAPNGRNADGTLKNTEFTLSNVLVTTDSSGATGALEFYLNNSGIYRSNVGTNTYNEALNIITNSSGVQQNVISLDTNAYRTNGAVTSFKPRTVFNAVDYSDFSNRITNILETIYPVGALYIGTQSTCPMAALISGSTWELVATDRALWGGNGTNANTTIAAGLPNITGRLWNGGRQAGADGAFYTSAAQTEQNRDYSGDQGAKTFNFDASRSSSVYRNDVTTVQPPAYVVNVWRRTA